MTTPETARRLDFQNDSIVDIHAGVPEDMIPKEGMEFESENDAYEFYNNYANKVGFSIRRSTFHKSDITGEYLDRTFCCKCQGKRAVDKRDDDVAKSRRAESRFGCLATMGISSRATGKLRVFKFVAKHEHHLASPSKSHLLRSQRKITAAQKAEIDIAESSGITPKATMEFLARQVGGRENVGFILTDCRNYLRSKRTVDMKVGDTGGVLEYLQKMQANDPNFSYAMQVDMHDLITNIFWADSRMKFDFSRFGDVVCFDTTYKINKEGRPFALFVGVNHHKQTVIFGAALLYDETAPTFEWLFDTFVKVMNGKRPQTILTDQDAAMSKALVSRWPEVYHRLCVWHLYQNAAKHLSGVFEKFKGFTKDFSSCIYDHDEVHTFLDAWDMLLEKYNLQDNEWLKRMFDIKEKWALAYGRHTFCADMSTTQRSESMNSQIKKYINYKHDLLRFFHHFERLVEDRRYEELREDFKANQTMPALSVRVEILEHAATVYTPKVFKMFYEEVWKTWNWDINLCREIESCAEFKITSADGKSEHRVTFDSKDCSVNCSCKKFEFVGILCSHALKVLSLKNVKRVPELYILRRWTKEAKSGSSHFTREPLDPNNIKANMAKRYKDLSLLFSQVAAKAAEFESTYEIALEGYGRIMEEITKKFNLLTETDSLANATEATCTENVSNIASSQAPPPHNNVKGLKTKEKNVTDNTGKRRTSALEKATKSKRSRKNTSARNTEIGPRSSSYSGNIDGLRVPGPTGFHSPITNFSQFAHSFKETPIPQGAQDQMTSFQGLLQSVTHNQNFQSVQLSQFSSPCNNIGVTPSHPEFSVERENMHHAGVLSIDDERVAMGARNWP